MSDTTNTRTTLNDIATDGLIDQHCRHVNLWHALGLGAGAAPTITLGSPTNTPIPDPAPQAHTTTGAHATNGTSADADATAGEDTGAPPTAAASNGNDAAGPGSQPASRTIDVRLSAPNATLDFEGLVLGDVTDNTITWAAELPIPEGYDHPDFHGQAPITPELIGATRTLLGNGLITFVRYTRHREPATAPARATAVYLPLAAPEGTIEQLYAIAQPALHGHDHQRALTGLAAIRGIGMRAHGDTLEFSDGSTITPSHHPTPHVPGTAPTAATTAATAAPATVAATVTGSTPAADVAAAAATAATTMAAATHPAPHTPAAATPTAGTFATLDDYYTPIALLAAEHQVNLRTRLPHAGASIDLNTNTVTLTTPAGNTTLGATVLATIGPNGWLWAHQDPALPPAARAKAQPLHAFATQHQLAFLQQPPATEDSAHKAISVAKAALGQFTSIRVPLAPGVDGIIALDPHDGTTLLETLPPSPALLWDIAHTCGPVANALNAARSWLGAHNITYTDHGDRLTFPLQGLTMVLTSPDNHHLEVGNQ